VNAQYSTYMIMRHIEEKETDFTVHECDYCAELNPAHACSQPDCLFALCDFCFYQCFNKHEHYLQDESPNVVLDHLCEGKCWGKCELCKELVMKMDTHGCKGKQEFCSGCFELGIYAHARRCLNGNCIICPEIKKKLLSR
jgi:hypothetical protein